MAALIDPRLIETFPGWEMVSVGLKDAAKAKVTPEACLVWIAAWRLGRDGLIDESMLPHRIEDPEHILYDLLCAEDGNAYGRYNSLLRRLVKFEHSLDWAHTRAVNQRPVPSTSD